MPTAGLWLQLAFVPVLIAINAFFVAAEYAVVTIRSTRVEELRRDGSVAARVLALLKADLPGALATIQICITATNLVIGAVAEPAMTAVLLALLRPMEVAIPLALARTLALVFALLIVTFLTVLLSELLPKALTLQYTQDIALAVARPIAVCHRVCRPIAAALNWSGNRIVRLFGLRSIQIEEPVHSEEELEMLVDRSDQAGEFHAAHGALLRRAFDFADLTVRHVMIPMKDAGVLESNMTVGELAQRMQDRPYTRWLLRDPQTQRVNGVVNTKMALFATALEAGDAVILHDLAIEPLFVSPDRPLVELLAQLRDSRQHIAVARDCDGTDLGLVTLEDVLGAIVGRIAEEAGARPAGLLRRRC